jgi:pimeloyl-ACP methyl ester carboxylesterase
MSLAQAVGEQLQTVDALQDLGRVSIAFDLGARRGWTVQATHGQVDLVDGVEHDATTKVVTDAETLSAIASGDRSGVAEFLDGHVDVRGNLALALRLDGLFDPDGASTESVHTGHIDAAGLDTFYLQAGSGPPVVLVHGLGATNASMLPTLRSLAPDHRVLAVDLPGFGESAKPLASYDAGFFARWLAGFLNAMGVDSAGVIGNSLGGRVALEMGLAFPERVDWLGLFTASPAFLRMRGLVPFVRMLRPELAAAPMRIPHAAVVREMRRWFVNPDRLHRAWYDAGADEFLRIFADPRARVAFFSAGRQIYLEPARGPHGFWDRLPELAPPALFLWGDQDPMVPPSFGPHVEAALPHAASVVLADCGHVPQFDQPEQTHRVLRKFLDAIS